PVLATQPLKARGQNTKRNRGIENLVVEAKCLWNGSVLLAQAQLGKAGPGLRTQSACGLLEGVYVGLAGPESLNRALQLAVWANARVSQDRCGWKGRALILGRRGGGEGHDFP